MRAYVSGKREIHAQGGVASGLFFLQVLDFESASFPSARGIKLKASRESPEDGIGARMVLKHGLVRDTAAVEFQLGQRTELQEFRNTLHAQTQVRSALEGIGAAQA